MCLFDDDHRAQSYLSGALQSALIGAEQVRTVLSTPKERIEEASDVTGHDIDESESEADYTDHEAVQR
jgi:hypothetical protein